MSFSRRTFLKRTATAAAMSMVGPGVFSPLLRAGVRAAGNPLRIPADLVGSQLTGAPVMNEIFPGTQTAAYGLNGTYLGPLIRRNRGDRFAVQMLNNIPDEDLILHWHGLFAPEEMDGHPRHAVGTGETYDYDFLIDQRAGTYWYHSHTDMITGPQVYKGLAGFFLVHDEEEQGLGLPAGEYDVPLAIQDKQVTENFQLIYDPTPQDVMRGWQGDTILVNGTPDAVFSAARTLYRFRLLNAANARVWKLAFSDMRTFHLIASDGGLLEKPVEVDSFYLPPGARAEILVDFSGDTAGTEVQLRSVAFQAEGSAGSRQGKPADLMTISIDRDGSSGGVIPAALSTIEKHDPEQALRVRDFRVHMVDGKHGINNLLFGMNRIDFEVPFDELEIWEFFNPTQVIHPMHVHGVQFQIIERNGGIWPEEQGWKDTVLLFPFDRVRVALRFVAHRGIFMLHCHNLEHEDDGMMMNFEVVGLGAVDGDDRSGAYLQAWPNPVLEHTTVRCRPASGRRELVLSDNRGREMMRAVLPAYADSVPLDLSGLAAGVYWCRVGTESLAITKR